MRNLAWIVVVTLLLFPTMANAAPAISGTSGAFNHHSSVTVSGTGFGSKSPVAPAKWDNGSSSAYTSLSNLDPVPYREFGTIDANAPWRHAGCCQAYIKNMGNAHGKNIVHYTNEPVAGTSGDQTGCATVGDDVFSGAVGGVLYLSFMMYPHSNMDGESSNKFYRLGHGSDTWPQSIWSTVGTLSIYDTTYGYGPYVSNDTVDWETYADPGEWVRMETVINNSTSPNHPAMWGYINGTATDMNGDQPTNNLTDINRVGCLGADFGNDPGQQSIYDWGEIYVDTTLARVEICSGATWAAKGTCEIQIPHTTWGDTSLQITVNQGSFADSSTNYLYVVDAAGDANANGEEVTFCAEEADTTAPTVTAFTIPATSTSLAVSISSFTATDAIGVTGYCINESASAPTAGSCSGSGWAGSAQTSYLFGSAGSKTLYAWAKDAAGNISDAVTDGVEIPCRLLILLGLRLVVDVQCINWIT